MNTFNMPYFGEINFDEDYFETEMKDSTGQEISITIDFEGEKPSEKKLKTIKLFLDKLEDNAQKIKSNLLSSEFVEDVTDYIDHHLDELADEPIIQNIKSPEEFVKELKIQSVNIYPISEERYFSFDFTISEELTDYLLVVDLFEDLSISYITTES